MNISLSGFSNLVNTEVNLPVESPHPGQTHPKEAHQLGESEMVDVVTSPRPHPDQSQLRILNSPIQTNPGYES